MVDRNRESGRSERGSSDRGGRERGASRDEGRGSDRGSSRDSGRDAPRSSRGGRDEPRREGFSYQRRERADVEKRVSMGNKEYDRITKDHVKVFSPAKGDNRVRFLPATWLPPEGKKTVPHYGYDLYVHYGVGADRASYLDLDAMLGKPDPITEEYDELKRSGASKDELRELQSKRRVGVYLIDRDDEQAGVQFWACPMSVDQGISAISVDKATGEVLNIDDPDEGYDAEFVKKGEGIGTEYLGFAISRRPSPLGSNAWLNFAVDNPIPEILQYYSYDEIAKAFGGGGQHSERDRGDDRGRSAEREETQRGGRDDDRGSESGRDRGRGEDTRSTADRGDRSGADRGGRGGRGAEREEAASNELTYEAVQGMSTDELDALCESDDRLSSINPNDAETDEELKGWICEDLKLFAKAKEPERGRRSARSEPEPEPEDRLAKMRSERARGR